MAIKKKVKKIKKTRAAAKKVPLRKKPAAKKSVKKAVRAKPVPKKPAKTKSALKTSLYPTLQIIGEVTHYFPHVRAAVIKLKAPLTVGDKIKIKGHTTDFTQVITSMQIDRVPITGAKKGDEIGLQVNSRVRQQDKVYKA